MRLLHRVERSFVAQIVDKTKRLVQSAGPVPLKVAVLRHWAQRQADRAERLEAAGEAKPKRRRLAEIRRLAAGYLQATARYLTHRQEHGMSLRERPRLFAVPTWENMVEAEEKDEEPQFMQFSS